MKKREIKRLLGSDLAQKDKYFLKYAVERNELMDELNDPENGLLIINSPRGSGKSGLVILHEQFLKKSSNNNVIIKKYYEEVRLPHEEDSLNKHVNFWLNSILGLVVSYIGANKGLAITDDSITCVEYSERSGEKELNIISSVLKRLKVNCLPFEKLDSAPELDNQNLSRIVNKSKKMFWLLLDEMDDLYSNSIARNHSLVALFQAANFITSKFNNIKIRITIRPHIYTYLKTHFDSIQKLRECVSSISWTGEELKNILARRIEFYDAKKNKSSEELLDSISNDKKVPETASEKDNDNKLISKYFDDFDMSFKEGKCSNYRALHTASIGRPRWMIELCKLALEQNPKFNRATINCFKLAFLEYGDNRVEFLSGEFREMYPFLEAAINSIVSARRVHIGSSKELRQLIKGRVINTNIVPAPEHASDNEIGKIALEIAHALFVAEFLRAKQNLGGRGDDHRFYSFTNRPSLLASWNKEPNISWEIHPTFARGLNLIDSQVYSSGGQTRNLGKGSRKKV